MNKQLYTKPEAKLMLFVSQCALADDDVDVGNTAPAVDIPMSWLYPNG